MMPGASSGSLWPDLDGQDSPATPSAALSEWPVSLDRLPQGWASLVTPFMGSDTGRSLSAKLQDRLAQGAVIYPPRPFMALELTPLESVKVVVLGQDPYHGPGQAEGLAFSVRPGVRTPPSLRNIFQELQRSLGLAVPSQGSLMRWAEQGVLLLNTCLTVEDGQPASHARWGWETLTDRLVHAVACRAVPTVFMLWGAHAQAKRVLIESAAPAGMHLVLQANHPSPLSARRPPLPFLGCGHFEQANGFLLQAGREAIRW
jgi:uracil-DNA glycosylase